MIIWIFWLSALASTIKCEPPVNSYLPPSAGRAGGGRPSSEYGPPGASNGRGNMPGSSFGGFGNQNQPQESYLPPGQEQFGQTPDTQYGPPSVQGRSFGQRGSGQSARPQGFGSQPQGRDSRPQSGFGSQPQQGFGSQPRDQATNSQYGRPGQGGLDSGQPGSRSSLDGNSGLQPTYGPPGRSQPGQRGQGTFGGPGANEYSNKDGIGGRPESSYGPPPTGSYQSPDGGFGSGPSPNKHGGQGQIPSSSYGVPDLGDEQSVYDSGAPNQQRGSSRAPSSSYGTPGIGNDQGGLNSRPQGRSGGQQPSASYGAPGFGGGSGRAGSQGQGSDFDGSESDEPAKYEFNYDVNDAQSGTKFGHTEQRDGATATGEYNVVLPDGRKQVVEYEAGLQGYKPMIRYEGAGSTGSELGLGGSRSQGSSSSQDGQGYPKEGPANSGGFLGNNNDIGLPRGGLGGDGPDRYQEPEDFGQEAPSREGEGYPRGGNSGRQKPDLPGGLIQRGQGFPSSNLGDNGLESFDSDNGYPRGGPQSGRGFSDGSFPGRSGQGSADRSPGSNLQGGGYPGNSPQEARGFPDSGLQGRDSGYPRGGPQNGRGLSEGRDSRGFAGEGPQSGKGFPSGRAQGGSSNGGPQGYPRGESQGNQDRGGLDSNDGYPRSGPINGGRGFPGQTGGQGGSVGYASGGPGRRGGFVGESQENNRFGGNSQGNDRFGGRAQPGFGAGSQGSMGYQRGGPQGGGRGLPGAAPGGDEGYPSGPPNGPRGSGF